MTILVIFGNKGKGENEFNVEQGNYVCGNNGDCIYFAEDKDYPANQLGLTLPGATVNTLLPVIQHNTGAINHPSQIAWLKRSANYEPLPIMKFSHSGEPFNTMRRLLASGSITTDEVSKFVESYSKRMVLQLIDNLAAWNALCEVSKDPAHKAERRKLINEVNKFLDVDLNNPDITNLSHVDALGILEAKAVSFC